MGKIKKYKNVVERFLSGDSGQRFFNFAYSIGAAVVIWGALFKILHLQGGNELLTIGMGTEVLMFILTAFDSPQKQYHWEQVFPVLETGNPDDRPDFASGAGIVMGAGAASAAAAQQEQEAQVKAAVGLPQGLQLTEAETTSLSESIQRMSAATEQLSKMADLSEEMAANAEEAQRQATLYRVDQTYWQVVSLEHKQRLAESYLQLVKKFDADVTKMVGEGVATRSDALSVSVKVNEAEMALTKVTDGLTLSKMLLCQICGLPVSESEKLIVKSEEGLARRPEGESQFASAQGGEASIAAANRLSPSSAAADSSFFTLHSSFENRPELRMLQNTVDISRQATNLMKAGNQPQVMLTGGYTVTNPNTFNGFERKFGGFWNVGLLVRIPVWNWGDVRYKVRASKGLTAIRQLELDETREKIELQVNQCTYRTEEAQKRLRLAQSSIERAEENLRTANLGFAEGVITPTTVMEAQTAWLQAQSERVDAEIEVRMAQTDLEKSLGTLGNNQ